MKIITKEYKVYTFNELAEEAKERAINDYYKHEDYPFLEDDIMVELKQIDQFFSDIKLQYSLSYCQGDGLSFSGEFNLEEFLKKGYSKKLKSSQIAALCDYIYRVFSEGNTGNYCYASKSDVDCEYNYNDENDILEQLWQDVLGEIQEYYYNLCKQLEKYGYSILEYRMDFNEFDEFCEDNEYNFFENGEMANL